MNKNELIFCIAQQCDFTQKIAADTLETTLQTVCSALAQGDSVAIKGFGTFSVATRTARVGRNPKTGEEMQVPAKRIVKFTAGKPLKTAMNPLRGNYFPNGILRADLMEREQ